MNLMKMILRVAAVTLIGVSVHAAEGPVDAGANAILAKLQKARPDLQFSQPQRSAAMAGIYEVKVDGGPVLYVSADGGYFIAGDMFALGSNGFVNVAEQQRQQERKALIAEIPEKDKIIFAPQIVKATITVFTDIDCGYCRKLHNEMAQLNGFGIAVHYLAFPRAGPDSESFRKIATAWCAADPKAALTRMKNGGSLPDNVCAGNPIAAQFLLGEKIGVSGTPALVLDDGTLVSGYRPAEELAKLLGLI